ncbi:MAG: DUF1579 family protein, partial [Thermoanaerobaculia bacterium]
MKLHTFLLALVLAPGVASLPCTSSAQEKKSGGDEKPEKKRKKGEGKKKKEANEEGKKPGEGALPPEFEAWMKVAAPGEAHKALEPMVGDWETHSKFIMSPEAPAMESKGTCKRTMILGGRFLQEELTGDFMG